MKVNKCMILMGFFEGLAEEEGVEPSSHFISSSTALKAARTTGCIALPPLMIAGVLLTVFRILRI